MHRHNNDGQSGTSRKSDVPLEATVRGKGMVRNNGGKGAQDQRRESHGGHASSSTDRCSVDDSYGVRTGGIRAMVMVIVMVFVDGFNDNSTLGGGGEGFDLERPRPASLVFQGLRNASVTFLPGPPT